MKLTSTKDFKPAGTDNSVPDEARGHCHLSHTALLLLLLCAFGPASWAQPMLPPGSLVNAADYTFDLSPGAIGAIFGERLSTGFESAQSLPLPTSIGGTSVEVTDGVRTMLLPLFMVSAAQINVQIPYGMGPDLTIRVISPEGESHPSSLSLAPRSPKLFTWDQSGTGSAVVSHSADSVVADRNRPVAPGEWITIWANGLGEVDPPLPAGTAPNDGSEGHPLHRVTAEVSVVINGQPADVSYAGLVPTQAGLYQVNAFTPHLDRVGDLEIAVTVDGISTQAGLTIPVRANGFYWVLGAGKFPNGQTRTAASGLESAIAFLHDDRASWGEDGYQLWSPAPGVDATQLATSGVALTLRNGDAIVYDNNGIEDGAHNGHYANTVPGEPNSVVAGLTAWFSQSTNHRAVTAGHFRLEQPTTFDQVIAYFDGNGDSALPFDPANSYNRFRVNIWSGGTGGLPANNTFSGDVLSSDSAAGSFSQSPTAVSRVFGDMESDPIHRLAYRLDQPVTLAPGDYWFASDLAVPEVVSSSAPETLSNSVRAVPSGSTQTER